MWAIIIIIPDMYTPGKVLIIEEKEPSLTSSIQGLFYVLESKTWILARIFVLDPITSLSLSDHLCNRFEHFCQLHRAFFFFQTISHDGHKSTLRILPSLREWKLPEQITVDRLFSTPGSVWCSGKDCIQEVFTNTRDYTGKKLNFILGFQTNYKIQCEIT